jgi:hypothetical protein
VSCLGPPARHLSTPAQPPLELTCPNPPAHGLACPCPPACAPSPFALGNNAPPPLTLCPSLPRTLLQVGGGGGAVLSHQPAGHVGSLQPCTAGAAALGPGGACSRDAGGGGHQCSYSGGSRSGGLYDLRFLAANFQLHLCLCTQPTLCGGHASGAGGTAGAGSGSPAAAHPGSQQRRQRGRRKQHGGGGQEPERGRGWQHSQRRSGCCCTQQQRHPPAEAAALAGACGGLRCHSGPRSAGFHCRLWADLLRRW